MLSTTELDLPPPPQKKTTSQRRLTLALLMVGDHQSVNRLLGIWLRPERWALVSFFHFMDSSKPLAFSLKQRTPPKASLFWRDAQWGVGKESPHPSLACCAPQSPYQKRPSQVGKYVPLKSVCSRMPSTPPSAWIMSVR